jgi:hypothetical protein
VAGACVGCPMLERCSPYDHIPGEVVVDEDTSGIISSFGWELERVREREREREREGCQSHNMRDGTYESSAATAFALWDNLLLQALHNAHVAELKIWLRCYIRYPSNHRL